MQTLKGSRVAQGEVFCFVFLRVSNHCISVVDQVGGVDHQVNCRHLHPVRPIWTPWHFIKGVVCLHGWIKSGKLWSCWWGDLPAQQTCVPPVETELFWRLFNRGKCFYDVELAAVNMFWYHLFRIKGFYRASMLFSRRSKVIQGEIHHKGGNTETNFCTLRGRKSGKMWFSNKTVWRRMHSGKQEITAADEGSRKNERTGKLNWKSPNQRDAQVNHSIY